MGNLLMDIMPLRVLIDRDIVEIKARLHDGEPWIVVAGLLWDLCKAVVVAEAAW